MAECDPTAILAKANESIVAARLPDLGDDLEEGPGQSQFAARTTPPGQFAEGRAFNCSLLASHSNAETDRLLWAAWMGDRMAWVVQTTDRPSTPFETAVRVDLLAEQPSDEWVDDDMWAVTVSTGNTVIL